MQTYLSDEEGGEQLLVLGNLSLKGGKLGVSCASERRLQSCKALVEGLLGSLVVGRSEDKYEDQASALGSGEREGHERHEEEIPPEVEARITEKFFDEYY